MKQAAHLRHATLVLLLLLLGFGVRRARAQAMPTASAPGEYVAIGGGASIFQADYGQRNIGGLTAYADINLTGRYGIEAEARYLRYRTSEDVTETNYFVGPRVAIFPGRSLRPYVKFLVGDGHIVLPFHYAEGDFFTLAPGAGLEYAIRDRYIVRIVDFEYQTWPQFSAGPQFPVGSLHPYGLSAGISIRLNSIPRFPNGHRLAR
jgi:hypothetical protein